MFRIAKVAEAAAANTQLRLVLDANPDYSGNKAFIDATAPGEAPAQERLKTYFRDRGIRYYAVTNISDTDELATAIGDYVQSNLGTAEQFAISFDRKPSDLADAIEPVADAFAGLYTP
jgi:hypothetical protein